MLLLLTANITHSKLLNKLKGARHPINLINQTKNQTMSQLQSRRDKVQRLTNQALKDKMHHKYMQGVYLLNQIAIRELQLFSNRINNLNKC